MLETSIPQFTRRHAYNDGGAGAWVTHRCHGVGLRNGDTIQSFQMLRASEVERAVRGWALGWAAASASLHPNSTLFLVALSSLLLLLCPSVIC